MIANQRVLVLMGLEDPIAYTNIQHSGVVTPDLASKREGAANAIKLASGALDPQTIRVLHNNHSERSEGRDVFAVAGASAASVVYPNQEKETGSLHRGNLEKIISERSLIDAGVVAPDEYGLGSIDIA